MTNLIKFGDLQIGILKSIFLSFLIALNKKYFKLKFCMVVTCVIHY